MSKRRVRDLMWMLRVAFNDWRHGMTPGDVLTREVRSGAWWLTSSTATSGTYASNVSTTWPPSPDNPWLAR